MAKQKFLYLNSFPVFSGTIDELLNSFKDTLNKNIFTSCVTLNAEIFILASQSEVLKSRLLNAKWITADGMGVIHAQRFLNKSNVRRITGSDICHAIAKEGCFSIYLLGAKQSVLDLVIKKFEKIYPDLIVKGSHHGYIEEGEFQRVVNDIANKKPDIILVGMGVEKQELFIDYCRNQLNFGIAIGVGGVFDVLSDTKPRAPYLIQRLSLEWLFRVVIEPKRVFRLSFLPKFIFYMIKEKLMLLK